MATTERTASTSLAPRVPEASVEPYRRDAQPYGYPPAGAFEEPDWRRLPGYRDVTEREWRSAKWQRQHTVKNLAALQGVFGDLLTPDLVASIERDQAERATMSMLVPPQMLNTMDETDL